MSKTGKGPGVAVTVEDHLLVELTDDWACWRSLDGRIQLEGEADETRRFELGIETVRSLLDCELIQVGDIRETDGFVAWDGNTAEILDRVRDVRSSSPPGTWMFDVWINSTESGNARGEDLIRLHPDVFPLNPPETKLWPVRHPIKFVRRRWFFKVTLRRSNRR